MAYLKRVLMLTGILALLAGPMAYPQQSGNSPSEETALTPAQLLQFLNQTISWYRQDTLQMETATPEEQFSLYDNHQIAVQAVRLAVDFARLEADTIAEHANSKQGTNTGGALPQYEALRQMQAKMDQNYKDTQDELNGDQKKLAATSGAARRKLESEVSELQAELALIDARRDAVKSMVQFVGSSATIGAGTADLRAQIEALASSVPTAANGTESSQVHSNTAPAVPASIAEPSGIWNLSAELFSLSSRKSAIDTMIARTNELSAVSQQLRAPFVNELRALSSKGDQLAAEADTANPSALQQERQQLDALAAQFRQISATVIPLSKQAVLLNLYSRNLSGRREVVAAAFASDLRNLGLRLGFLVVLFAILFGLSELWRRAVFRYVHEPRRRNQFLLLRKIALWLVIALMIAVTLAGKLGSFATFAGLLTAGIALAMQNVIVAIVGYFFLIGKYGIRVGDRVQASGTTGEVIDVGLVRFHLMELGKGGTPTGRVVAFSNSVVFQPTGGLFKEIPGTSFAWHEVTTTVPRSADFSVVREKLLEAVESVLRDYREDISRQYQLMEKTGILLPERGLRARFDLRVTPAGVEATIRYPVDLAHAAEIDARISRELLSTLESESDLKAAKRPEVHVKTDVSTGTR
ncbi:MAG TPA: hypothetical protein VN745_09400 [Verrucomicrobiae bacterium]|nr:hypothetical protein [Verrucomicrobiae bacterium]